MIKQMANATPSRVSSFRAFIAGLRSRGIYSSDFTDTPTAVDDPDSPFESWTGEPIGRVDLRDVNIRYAGRSAASWKNPIEAARALIVTTRPEDVHPPGIDSRPLPAWGLYARHVRTLRVVNVRLSIEPSDSRPMMLLDDVNTFETDEIDTGSTVMKNVRDVRSACD